jgi:hypothetical protein
MSRRLAWNLALLAAFVVLVAGIGYTSQRTIKYQSQASLVLAPTATSGVDASTLLDSFTAGGTSGTFVELIASPDTLVRAGSPPVKLQVRAVPDSRVINVTATGARNVVQPALTSVVAAVESEQTGLHDLWSLQTLASPGGATRSGPSTPVLVVATVLLALLAAIATFMVLVRTGASRTIVPDERLFPRNGAATGTPDGDPMPAAEIGRQAPRA